MREVFLFRHGQTDLNSAGIVQGQGVDPDLNTLGKLQAKWIYEKFKGEGFELIITSELRRSQQTLQSFIDDNISHLVMREINEINWGIHEGKPATPKGKAAFKKLINNWKSGNFKAKLEGGESGEELADRIIKFWNFVYSSEAKKIAVCSHGRAIRGILSYFMKGNFLHMESFQHENGALYHLRFSENEKEIILSNDICHLKVLNEI